jgi:hypothetical protein
VRRLGELVRVEGQAIGLHLGALACDVEERGCRIDGAVEEVDRAESAAPLTRLRADARLTRSATVHPGKRGQLADEQAAGIEPSPRTPEIACPRWWVAVRSGRFFTCTDARRKEPLMAEESREPTLSEEDAQKAIGPTILELQKLLVDRLRRGTLRPNGGGLGLESISITSCEHHSCH